MDSDMIVIGGEFHIFLKVNLPLYLFPIEIECPKKSEKSVSAPISPKVIVPTAH